MSYKVQKGDTLSGIAKAHNMSLDSLLKLNGISKDNANYIRVGQEIKVTGKSSGSSSKSTSDGYTVQAGDGWYRIAQKTGIKVEDLLATNNATLNTTIHPGQKLKYPTAKPELISKSKSSESQTGTSSEYAVKAGDGWYRIAQKTGTRVEDLLSANNATLKTVIHPGQKLALPSTKGSPSLKSKNPESKSGSNPYTGSSTQAEITAITPYDTYIAWTPTIGTGKNCGVDGCAKYANDSLIKHKDKRGRIMHTVEEIGGNAWQRLSLGKNVRMIYSGYDGMPHDTSNAKDQETYKLYLDAVKRKDKNAEKKYAAMLQQSVGNMSVERNKVAANRFLKEFDSSKLDKNRVYMVNMYFKGSPSAGVAWYDSVGGTTGTHTGNVYWDPKRNSWRVSHNIHGIIHDDDFKSTQGSHKPYAITAIAEVPYVDYTERDAAEAEAKAAEQQAYREAHPIGGWFKDTFGMWKKGGTLIPRAKTGIKTNTPTEEEFHYDIEPAVVTNIAYRPELGKAGNTFIKGVNDRREYYMQKYGMTDQEYTDLAASAVNLAQQESSMGSGKRYIAKDIWRQVSPGSFYAAKTASNIWDWINGGNFGSISPSLGMTQIKWDDDMEDPVLKQRYVNAGVNRLDMEHDPRKQAHATLERLHHNRGKMKSKYHWSDGTVIDQDTADALYWNYGRLTDGENVNPDDPSAKGASARARRFQNNRIIK